MDLRVGTIKWEEIAQGVEAFKRLAIKLKEHLGGVVRGVFCGRSNAYVEPMNGLLQQAKTAARGFRDIKNFVAMA